MPGTTISPARIRVLALAIIAVQLFDIILHAATNQLEPIRVASNVVIIVWLALVLFDKLSTRFLLAASIAIGLYLVLNLLFLAREGITNPAQGDALRLMLFALVFLTVALSGLLTYLGQRHA